MKISKADAIKVLLDGDSDLEIIERLDRIERKLDFLLSAIVIRQKDACGIAGITQATARNMALRGDLEPLQADGSTRNFYQLSTVKGLKPRRQIKKK